MMQTAAPVQDGRRLRPRHRKRGPMPQDPVKPDPALLARIAEALERLAPPPAAEIALTGADAFVWHAEAGRLTAVPETAHLDIALLAGIDRHRGPHPQWDLLRPRQRARPGAARVHRQGARDRHQAR